MEIEKGGEASSGAADSGGIINRTPQTKMVGAHVVLRAASAVLTLICLCLIASDNINGARFSDVPAFNYLLAASILCFLYTLAQLVMAVYSLFSAKASSSLLAAPFVYFSLALDLFCAILLLSSSSAAFGITSAANNGGNFISQASASASMALIAFCFMSSSATLSVYRLFFILRTN